MTEQTLRILVTGASGFVGRALCARLSDDGYQVLPAVRQPLGMPDEVVIGDIGPETDWRSALLGCDVVVHLAARVHMMSEYADDVLAVYRRVNVEATVRLAQQAVEAGVKRFVFVSSVKVNGEGRDSPYHEADGPAPQDAYSRSKWEAEKRLKKIAQETALELVVLRPPLVYGPGVKANFYQLIRKVDGRLPLPFAAMRNTRSYLYLGNFVDVIACCLMHPAAVDKTYLLADGVDISVPDLIRLIGKILGRQPHLFTVPSGLIRMCGFLLGQKPVMDRLLGSLTVDDGLVRRELGWKPPYSMSEGLEETVRWYLGQHSR